MDRIGKGMIAGFVATAVLSMMMVAKSAMGLMPQLDIIRMMSGMMGSSAAMAWVVHFLIGTVLWGAIFAWLDPHLPGGSHWLKGVVFGLGAWLLMMVLMMPMAGAGLFGLQIGVMAPIMTMMLHAIFGAILGATYGWLLSPREEALVARHR